MNNNGMIEYKESFITRLNNFFKKLFSKQNIQHNNIQQEMSNKRVNHLAEDEKKDDFINGLKLDEKELKNVVKKDNFLKEMEENPEKLNMLSIDRLKKIEQHYDNIIEENERKIKKLKNA